MMARKPEPCLEQLLTIGQVAELLGTTERFPRRLIEERRIRFVRVGRHVRVPESALREFIAAGLVEPVARRGRRIWLTLKEAEIRKGDWINPNAGQVSFAEYARAWIEERPGLRPTRIELYRYLLRKHLKPIIGYIPIADIQPEQVRRWRKHLLANQP
jgi:excisionase family DNA binding protein